MSTKNELLVDPPKTHKKSTSTTNKDQITIELPTNESNLAKSPNKGKKEQLNENRYSNSNINKSSTASSNGNDNKREKQEDAAKELCLMGDHYYLEEIQDFINEHDHLDCNKIQQYIMGKYYNQNTVNMKKFKEHIHYVIHTEMPKLYSNNCHTFSKCAHNEECKEMNNNEENKKEEHKTESIISDNDSSQKKIPQLTKNKPSSITKFNLLFDIKPVELKTVKSDSNVHLKYPIPPQVRSISSPQSNDEEKGQSSPSEIIIKIKKEIEAEMYKVLGDRAQDNMKAEAENSQCCSVSVDSMDKNECQPLKRIEIVLDAYYRLIDKIDKSFWCKTEIADIIQVEGKCGKYEHQQLINDFYHIIYIHIIPHNNAIRGHDHDEYDECKYNNAGAKLCQHLEAKYPCKYSKDIQQCVAFTRHYRERTNDEREQALYFQKRNEKNDNEIAFQQECDKIHSYFSHSTIKFGPESKGVNAEQEAEIDRLNLSVLSTRFSKSYLAVFDEDASEQKTEKKTHRRSKTYSYVGKKEDDLWWKDVSSVEEAKQTEKDKQSDDEIYRILVGNIGVFRWQNPHGFRSGQNQETAHYTPKWSNIKSEALNNKYAPVSKDNWNQTLRKSKLFFQSWARQKIRTKYEGYFDDQVTEQKQEWKEGIEITMQEVVTLKLYTDFDKLQFALKKCFRFETLNDILEQNDDEKEIASQKETKQELKNRLESFYHWRGGLLIVLNKFGTKLNHQNNMVLYHGVNAKMLIKTSQTLAFNGPLSTTSSPHVARIFATAKGTILKITSHFPRLNYCNAFDASLISDYPEEQEWLVGFMYVRILEVRTRKLFDKVESFWELIDKVPLSSWIREEFFAVHLFNEQIFSMSEHLERILAQFLKVNRKECCDETAQKKYQYQYDHFKDWGMDCMCDYICNRYHKQMIMEYGKSPIEEKHKQTQEDNMEDIHRKHKVFPIIWKKFNEFRKKPNLKQRIKFDTISDRLKRFFMEEIEDKEINTDKKRWVVSFDEITTVYPNVKEIHFINQYKLDEKVLENLINQIKKEKNNTINKIVFLYYNYKNTDDEHKPLNDKIFQDPDTLKTDLKDELKTLGWTIKHTQNGNTGYKIRIYQT